MTTIDLSAATIEYEDTGGNGPVIVFVPGLLMDATLWRATIATLRGEFRCVAPTLPLGAHRHPVRPNADVSLTGQARLLAEFLDRLDLTDVTLVGNDTGGAIVQLVLTDGAPRVARAVLISCEAYDNLPPGLTGRTLALTGRLSPRLFGLFMQQLRVRLVRRLPIAFGWLTRRGDAVTAGWLRPILTRPEIRRDTVRLLRAVFADRTVLERAAPRLATFDRPALVVWAAEDRVMPPEHGRSLAQALPQSELVEIADSYTLIPLDQPDELGAAIARFVPVARGAGGGPGAGGGTEH